MRRLVARASPRSANAWQGYRSPIDTFIEPRSSSGAGPRRRHPAKSRSGPRSRRVAATSLAPSASPCAFSLPAWFGAPLPITVRATIRVGRPAASASPIARSIPSTSWPSTGPIMFQGHARKRVSVSSVNPCRTSPSIEMPLSSQMTTSLHSRRVPASDAASCEMPPHEAPVAGEDGRAMVDGREARPLEFRDQQPLGQRHADRAGAALPEGPEVVSTPGASLRSGWPGVRLRSCLNCASGPIGGSYPVRYGSIDPWPLEKGQASPGSPLRDRPGRGAGGESTAPRQSPPCPMDKLGGRSPPGRACSIVE
jgi:hypothetical protein